MLQTQILILICSLHCSTIIASQTRATSLALARCPVMGAGATWRMGIEVMGGWEMAALHTIRREVKRGSEARLPGGAPRQIRFRLDICDSWGSKWNLYTTQRGLNKSNDLNALSLKKSDLSDGADGDEADTLWLQILSPGHKDSIAGHGGYIFPTSFESSSPS